MTLLRASAYKQASSLAIQSTKLRPLSSTLSIRTRISIHSQHYNTNLFLTPFYRTTSTMTSNIVLPNLSAFVQGRVTALYTAKTPADFDSAFDLFVAEDARITVNGRHVSRDNYKKMVQGEITGDMGGSVQVQGVVSVPDPSKDARAIGVGAVMQQLSPYVC